MKKQMFMRPAPHCLRRAARLAGVLCLLTVAAAGQHQWRSAANRVLPSEWAAPKHKEPGVLRYFRLGRLQGDARTVAALICYLLEPEPPNALANHLGGTALPMRTNCAPPAPGKNITVAHQAGKNSQDGAT